jgi:fermentation-respiration switch protein FrsA (DUF1100 family)
MFLILAFEKKLLFFPARAEDAWVNPAQYGLSVEDVYLESSDGNKLHGWWCPCAGVDPSAGAVLYLHGNAGNLSYRAGSIVDWHDGVRLPVFIIDYPGYGRSTGTPSEKGCYAAANAAYDWLINEQKVPPDRIIFYGGSLGGAPAIELALHRPHRVLVLTRTFTSIPDMANALYPWLLPARWLIQNRFDNLGKIGRCPKPIFLAHGDVDQVVPFAQGKRLYEAAPEPKRFYLLAGLDHNQPLGEGFFAELLDFLAQVESRPVARE